MGVKAPDAEQQKERDMNETYQQPQQQGPTGVPLFVS